MQIFSAALRTRLFDKLLGRKRPQAPQRGPGRAVTELGAVRELLAHRKFDQAAESCHAFLDLFPDRLDGLTLAFRIALMRGHVAPTLRYLEQAITLRPESADLPFMLGYLQIQNGEAEMAIQSLQKALAIEPNSAKAINSIGVAFQILEQFEEALKHFQMAHEIDPGFWRASYNIANMTRLFGRFADSVAPFQQALRGRRGPDAILSEIDIDDPLLSHSTLMHDSEQLDYLAAKGLLDARFKNVAGALRLAAITPEGNTEQYLSQAAETTRSAIAPFHNRLLNFYNAPALPQGAINQDQDWDAIAASYFSNGPGMTYFDNFLKPAALASLRRFCLESTVWFDSPNGGGYVGATCEDGFICPLLAQIAEELRFALHKIFSEHRLKDLRARKRDYRSEALDMHPDPFAVKAHFWSSRDESDDHPHPPENGALAVWDKEAPSGEDFGDHSARSNFIKEFLQQSGAQPWIVPHRQNRIVLLNARLPYRIDATDLAPSYENQRIEVTMSYGDRAR